MKLNFKKISAVLGSAVLAGATLGFAAAANFPQPFVKDGVANVAIVYGSGSGVASFDSSSDALQAGNIQSALAKYVSGGSTTIEGESKNLGSNSRKLYYGDAINSGYASLSASELPTVLADGTFTDLSGTQYTYTQTITPGARTTLFGTSGGDYDDPALYVDIGTDASNGLYNYTLSFNKNLNVSDDTNVQGQKISILGVDYIIGASSTNSTVYLYGSGSDIVLNSGESQTVTVGGASHDVTLTATTDTTTAKITVDGVSKTVTQGNSYAFAGDLNVYVKDVTYQGYQGGIQSAELLVGANTLKLVNGQTVKEGADATSIHNTLATITAAGAGEISSIKISVAAPKSQEDSLVAGDSFTDPVFGGFKMTFADANPDLLSADRGKIVVDTDNNQFARVMFTAYGADEQQLTYTYDNDTLSGSVAPILAHKVVSSNNEGIIHVLEGENAKVNDWIVVNQGDGAAILEVTDISIDTATEGTVGFENVLTGDTVSVSLANNTADNVYNKSGVNMFGGTGYLVSVNGGGTFVNITWDSTTATTLFPRIKLSDGGWLAFLAQTDVPYADVGAVIFPDGQTTIETTGTDLSNATATAGTYTASQSGLYWNLTNQTNGNVRVDGLVTTTGSCNFSSTAGPAILFLEPKKWDDGSYGDVICVPMTTAGSTEIAIAQAVLNSTNSGFTTLTSDTYESQAVDKFGTLVTDEQRTNQNGVETLSYPSSQMIVDILATSEAATVSSSALGNVLFKDTEKSSWQDKNVVIVGGSCINSAAASALGVSEHTCGAAFTAETGVGSGQFLIKGVDGAFANGKLALVVAGYEASDTINAATYLTKKTVDTSETYKGTSSTSAEMVVA